LIKKLKSTVSRLLPKNQFARGISVLVGGTAGSQLVMLLASPLLTRLFSPEEFGLLAVYTSFLALFTVVTSLRYELAIPLPTDEKEAVNVVILSLLIVVAISLISALMVIFSGAALATLFGVSTLSDYLWFLPIGVFFVGTYQVFNFWAIRQKNFGGISKTRIKQAITTLIIQLIGYKLGVAALIGGHAGGQGVGSLALAGNSFKRNFFYQVSLSGIVTAAQRYRKFPLYSTWAGLFNTLGGQLPLLMFAALFSPVAAGL
jgi:O-antigen/teichoic acid export membrane protein